MAKKPRNVRNFWITLEVDGKATKVATGPVSKDGGFRLRVFMRNDGEAWEAANLNGYAENGDLRLVFVPDQAHTIGPVDEVMVKTKR